MQLGRLKNPDCNESRITGDFFKFYQDLLLDKMIPHQMEMFDKEGGVWGLKRLAGCKVPDDAGSGGNTGSFIEAVSYALMLRKDEKLLERAEEIVSCMYEAQLSDGYIGNIDNPNLRFKSLMMSHEHFYIGHAIEAMLAYHEATGNPKSLIIAKRLGDCLCQWFGYGDDQIQGYCGHPEVEMALYRLYEYTREEKYLDIMKFFIDERGQRNPVHYFDWEQERNEKQYGRKVVLGGFLEKWAENHRPYFGNYEYFQAHMPAREIREPYGHAVRAMYFYCGMADLATATGDIELKEACKSIFRNLMKNNMYITGGIGQEPFWEGIGKAYDLPPMDAYNETCASVGLILFAQRMLKLEPCSCYADVMERALYNTVLGGVSLDGEKFTYCNQLQTWPYNTYRYDKRSAETERWSWTSVACCPPNLSRLLGEIVKFQYMYDSESDVIYVNLFMSSDTLFILKDCSITIKERTKYPWDGKVEFTIDGGGKVRLHIRIPEWCKNASLSVNSEKVDYCVENGYACIERNWKNGDVIVYDMQMEVQRVYANPEAYYYNGMVAVTRGPLVYCLEEVDNGRLLTQLQLPAASQLCPKYEPALLNGCWVIEADAERINGSSCELYSYIRPTREKARIRYVPYFLRFNRECGEMTVFLQELIDKTTGERY